MQKKKAKERISLPFVTKYHPQLKPHFGVRMEPCKKLAFTGNNLFNTSDDLIFVSGKLYLLGSKMSGSKRVPKLF